MRKKLVFAVMLMFCLLISVNTALSAPPVTSVFSGQAGYDIRYPLINYIKLGNDASFHFHVFNLSNGMPVFNDTTSCAFHLYNATGSHTVTIDGIRGITDVYDFEVEVGGGNFSREGSCFYIFQCNSTTDLLGGYVTHELFVTRNGDDGYDKDDNSSLTIIMAVFLVLTLLVVYGIASTKHVWLKVVLAVALNILIMTLLRFASWFLSITNPLATNLINTLDHYFAWSVYSLYFLIAGSMLFLVVYILNSIRSRPRRKNKEQWEEWGKDD